MLGKRSQPGKLTGTAAPAAPTLDQKREHGTSGQKRRGDATPKSKAPVSPPGLLFARGRLLSIVYQLVRRGPKIEQRGKEQAGPDSAGSEGRQPAPPWGRRATTCRRRRPTRSAQARPQYRCARRRSPSRAPGRAYPRSARRTAKPPSARARGRPWSSARSMAAKERAHPRTRL
jgi:hypothetical protein